MQPQFRTLPPGIEHYSRRSDSLCHDRGYRSPLDAPVQLQDEKQVENDIQCHRECQKPERSYRISHRTQHRRIEIIDKRKDNAAKDYPEVTAHHAVNVLRHLQQTENGVQPYEYRHIQHARDRPYQYERHENAAAQGGMVSRTVMQREYRAAADRQTEKDGDKEDHQRIRRPYRRQCIRTDALPYNQRIGYVIALLQQRTRHHRQGETQQRTRYATPGKVSVP